MTTTIDDYIIRSLLIVSFSWLIWRTCKFLKPRNQHSLRSVAIIVLGDIGRSPRMMYHAQSFAENDFITDLIGYGGSKPIPALERLPKLQLHYLAEPPKVLSNLPFILLAPIKIAIQVLSILFVLTFQIVQPPEFILVQNPPTIPTLAIAWLVAIIRGSRVIIDWHNLGYSILALKLGENHIFVKIAKWFEVKFGRTAYAHLFVTQAMHDYLVENWSLQGHRVVLHDRPPHHFHRSSAQEMHELFLKLQPSLAQQESLAAFLPEYSAPYSTPLTYIDESSASPSPPPLPLSSSITKSRRVSEALPTYSELRPPKRRSDRPALLVSSTSWTPDEDFGILLDAIGMYESRARELHEKAQPTGNLPKLLVVVTGKGPLKDKYMQEVGRLQEKWKWVRCTSLWLEAEDYPLFLGSADLGVCLHASSSALDLPMKIVDMFGCGLPVCALDFACLDELVKNEINGLIFTSAIELATQLESLFTSFPESTRLDSLHSSLRKASQLPVTASHLHSPHDHEKPDSEWHWGTWEDNWASKMRPLILSDVSR